MIGVFGQPQGSDPSVRLPITYGSLTLNSDLRAAEGDAIDIYEINSVQANSAYDFVSEVRQSKDGSESYLAKKVNLNVRMDGIIRCENMETLNDRIKDLAAAFDPALVGLKNPTTYNQALGFYTPSASGTATSFSLFGVSKSAGNLVRSYYLARPKNIPAITYSQFNGTSVPFSVELLVTDPRRYAYTGTTKTAVGTISSGELGGATYSSWPTLTLTMSAAGSATHAISITSSVSGSSVTRTLTLNLSAATNGSVYVINMENGSIKKDGTEARSLYVSGEFWDIPAFAGQSWSVTSTGVSTRSLAWNPAFSV
jgi:hypothetical protein